MARPIISDFYQAFRFAVVLGQTGSTYVQKANAGFNNVTIPEVNEESAEYREGTFTWTKKQPGVPTVGDCTLQQGVSSIKNGGSGSPFFDWIMAAINGKEYRDDVTIWHIHRADTAKREGVGDLTGKASRRITLNECYPIRVKPDGDLDGTSSEISISEMDLACESISVEVEAPGA